MRLDELKRAGHEVLVLYGTFSVPHNTSINATEWAKRNARKKFERHFALQGWRLESAPVIEEIKEARPTTAKVVQGHDDVLIVVPQYERNTMRADNPLFKLGRTMFSIGAWFSKPPKQVFFEIDDKVWARVKDKVPLRAVEE